MTSTASVISLANRSLLMVGSRSQISSLSEGSTEANAISVLYQPTYEQLSRTAPWNCLRQQKELTLLAAAEGTPENVDGTTMPLPPTPWLYEYATPSDSLQIRYLVPTLPNSTPSGQTPLTTASYTTGPWLGASFNIPFAVAYSVDSNNAPREVVLTNQSQAQAVYTVNQPNPTVFDSLFEQALVASLGAYLVPALSLDLALMDRCKQTAEQAISIARVRDGNEGTTSQDHIPDWIRARSIGGAGQWGYGGALAPWGSGNWTAMAWPGA